MSLHQTDNEKERTAQPATFLPFLLRPGREAADVAVNRTSTWRSAVDEGVSRWRVRRRQSRNCNFVAQRHKRPVFRHLFVSFRGDRAPSTPESHTNQSGITLRYSAAWRRLRIRSGRSAP